MPQTTSVIMTNSNPTLTQGNRFMRSTLFPKFLTRNFAKFLISGGFNTALTYGLYLLLLMFLPYTASYTISYIIGITFAYLLNRFFVFKSHQGIKSVAMLPLVYLVQYVVSMLIVWCWVEKLGFIDRLAPLVSIIITIPFSYIFSKFAFQKTM